MIFGYLSLKTILVFSFTTVSFGTLLVKILPLAILQFEPISTPGSTAILDPNEHPEPTFTPPENITPGPNVESWPTAQ